MDKRRISMVERVSEEPSLTDAHEIVNELARCQEADAVALLDRLNAPLATLPDRIAVHVSKWLQIDSTAERAAQLCERHQLHESIPHLRAALAHTGQLESRLAILSALASLGERKLFLRTIRSMLLHGKDESAETIVACLERAAHADDAEAIFALRRITPEPLKLRILALAYRYGILAAYGRLEAEIKGLGAHISPQDIDANLRAMGAIRSQRFTDLLLDYSVRESRPFFSARARAIATGLAAHGLAEPTPDELFEKAKGVYFQGDYEAADVLMEELFALGVDRGEWRHLHASCLRELGRHEEAQSTCETGLAVDPSHWQTHRLLGSILWDLKEHELAIAAYDRGLALNPTDSYGWYYKGYALHCLEDDEAALPCIDRALSLKKNSAYLYNQKAFCLERLGRHTDAVACYKRSLALQPDDPAVRTYMGQALQQLKAFDEALQCYDTVLSQYPDRDDTLYYRADVLYDMGEWTACDAAYEAYLKQRPDSYHALFNRGLCLRFLEQFQAAARCFEAALEIRHDSATAKKHLAYCLKRSRELDKGTEQ